MDDRLSQIVKNMVKQHHRDAVALSDDLAAHPELSYKEFESSRKMVELLQKSGFQVEYPYMGYETAFRTMIDNGEGAEAAILVEYDALPGIGHGCGHNAHGAMAILAGLAMGELRDRFKGKLHIIGTPAEEEDGAKVGMADKGIFDDMAVAMMIHSYAGGASQPNMDALSLSCYLVEFRGHAAHAAACPWEGHSALAAARKFLDLIDARRECFTPDVRASGIITDGGLASNIIPERAEVRIEFRTGSMRSLKKMDDVVMKCAKAAAMALDCTVSWKPALADFADMVRVLSLEEEVARILGGLGEKVTAVTPPIGSTDMGNVSYRCPSIQPLLSITKEKLGLHTQAFSNVTTTPEAHEAIARGAEALVLLSLKVFNDSDFRKEVHEEFLMQRDLKNSL